MQKHNQTPLNDQELEALFSKAIASEPVLQDDVFSTSVMAAIRQADVQSRNEAAGQLLAEMRKPRFSMLDMIGLGVGIAACSMVVDTTSLLNLLNGLIPDSFTLSANTLMVAAAGMGLLSIAGWWAIEGDRRA